MNKVLFVCSRNRLRSPTAEAVFAAWPAIEATSAGLNHDATTALTCELVEWADIIFVMEKSQRQKLSTRFGRSLHGKKVVCLDVPDRYRFMDPGLIKLLLARVPQFLG